MGGARKLLPIALIVLISGCTTTRTVTKEVPVVAERVKYDTLMLTRWRVDTCVLRDSVVVTEQGVDRWHTRIVTRDRIDTVYKARTDTVPKVVTVTKEVTKEVEKPLKWWQKALIICSAALSLVFIVLVIVELSIVRSSKDGGIKITTLPPPKV